MTLDFGTGKNSLTSIFGEYCFSDSVMKERLPKDIYKELKKVRQGDKKLSLEVANVVANTMKDWAIEKGATHFTHWFQPLTGLTAEKHDSFISPVGDGTVIMEFSGKELVQGEPDASSFPNGGLRETFEARGYTAWDVSSPAFLKADKTGLTLAIPTAFFSYTGEALDKKVPLLRSMEAVEKQALRLIKALGNTTSKKISVTVGPEQEYFLVEKKLFEARPDLKFAGRTVFGSMPVKGQEMEDHYFGAINERVTAFMAELNYELWKLGITAKTQHNEVAPNQFELAIIFDTANVSTDTNQLVMEMMKKLALRHDLVALLHEKPFAGVNGSGKHNNWSIATDDGINLLNPGSTPSDNSQFLIFTSAVIKAIDMYAPLLRASAANAGNDHRLGGNEAPPAIISMFLGDQLTEIFEGVAEGKKVESKDGQSLKLGANAIPDLPKDLTDRNRTSPFAFTGNKFEFRMVGSSQSLAGPNVVINTAVADILGEFADILEKATDLPKAIEKIVGETYKNHKRIIFNGNGYSPEWEIEAKKRGLANLRSTVEAVPEFIKDYTVKLFEKHGVFSKKELHSRYDIYLEEYAKRINIEAGLAVQMVSRNILPAVNEYLISLCEGVNSVKSVSGVASKAQVKLIEKISSEFEKMIELCEKLDAIHDGAEKISEVYEKAVYFRNQVIPAMENLREVVDGLEKLCDEDVWPFPSYAELLFNM
ncbi:MAG: glutamine synthetase III [Spirochaetales bacterium]|nr:glutamine synthetase III [Spirochaetales bacterium]